MSMRGRFRSATGQADPASITTFVLTMFVITTIFIGMSKLQEELKQSKPFAGLEEEVILNLMRTSGFLAAGLVGILKQAGLTATQYNALRILRGAAPEGLSCREIGTRMVTRESDITRLLDRLEKRGLISRRRPAGNRRLVLTRITGQGLKTLAGLDAPVLESHRQQVGHLGKSRLKALNRTLEALRSKSK